MFLFSAHLPFQIWIRPEGKQLRTPFNKLRKLSLHGIFVEFDLLWMIVLLEAAPSIEIFDIEVLSFPCFSSLKRIKRKKILPPLFTHHIILSILKEVFIILIFINFSDPMFLNCNRTKPSMACSA